MLVFCQSIMQLTKKEAVTFCLRSLRVWVLTGHWQDAILPMTSLWDFYSASLLTAGIALSLKCCQKFWNIFELRCTERNPISDCSSFDFSRNKLNSFHCFNQRDFHFIRAHDFLNSSGNIRRLKTIAKLTDDNDSKFIDSANCLVEFFHNYPPSPLRALIMSITTVLTPGGRGTNTITAPAIPPMTPSHDKIFL